MVENCRAVLRSEVRTLAVQLRGIVILPKGIQQNFIGNLFGLVANLNRFSMPRAVSAHVLVSRVFHFAAGVTNTRGCHARNLPECCFDTPEASGCKCRFRHELLPSAYFFIKFDARGCQKSP